jgi:hypothetical protein
MIPVHGQEGTPSMAESRTERVLVVGAGLGGISIYGVVSGRRKNYSLKAPKRSALYANLYFVGGSVNPGGGTPMVVASGQQAARLVVEDLERPAR